MKPSTWKLFIAIIACVLCSSLRGAADTPSPEPEDIRADLNAGAWARGPNLPSPRQDAAAVVVASRVYLIGGFGPHLQQMDTTLVWDPQVVVPPEQQVSAHPGSHLGAWVYAAPIPESVDHAAAAAYGNYIYVAGGRIENLVSNKVWRYDVSADSWAELPSMPIPRYGAVMQAVNGKLYLIGGAVSHGADERSIEVFDIATGHWDVIYNALAAERVATASALVDGKIILLGGRDDDERNFTACDIFDPATHRWGICSPMRIPRSDFGLSAVAGRLIAVGGEDLRAYAATQTMEISEPSVRGWLSGPWLPGPRHGMAQVTVGNIVWVMGGSSTEGVSPSTVVLRYVSPVVRVKLKGRAGP